MTNDLKVDFAEEGVDCGNMYVGATPMSQDVTDMIIPAGTLVPIKLETVVGSQISNVGDTYTAKALKNYVTKEKYLLISEGSDMKGQVKYVQTGNLFKQHGQVIIKNELLVTPLDQAVMVYGVATLEPKKIGFWRSIFKGAQGACRQGRIRQYLLRQMRLGQTPRHTR